MGRVNFLQYPSIVLEIGVIILDSRAFQMSSFLHTDSSQDCSHSRAIEVSVSCFTRFLFFHIWGSYPGNAFPMSSLWDIRDRMRGRPQECFFYCESYFQSLLPFSISCIHEMVLSSLTPPFFSFLEIEQGLEERTGGNSHCISVAQWLRWGLDEGGGRGRELESALQGAAKRLLS